MYSLFITKLHNLISKLAQQYFRHNLDTDLNEATVRMMVTCTSLKTSYTVVHINTEHRYKIVIYEELLLKHRQHTVYKCSMMYLIVTWLTNAPSGSISNST